MKMNKTEFCAEMAERCGMSKTEAARQYDNVMGCLYDFIAEGNEVNIFGLCRFSADVVPSHEARNPLNGETIVVPDRHRLTVKLSKVLKDTVKALPVEE